MFDQLDNLQFGDNQDFERLDEEKEEDLEKIDILTSEKLLNLSKGSVLCLRNIYFKLRQKL